MSDADYRDTIGCDVGRPEAIDVDAINPSSAVRQLAECGQRLSSVLWDITDIAVSNPSILWAVIDTAESNGQFAKRLGEIRSIQEDWKCALERIQESFIYNCDWDDYDWGTARECVAEDRVYRDKLALLYPDDLYPDEKSDHE